MARGQSFSKKKQLSASRAIQGVEWLESSGEEQVQQREKSTFTDARLCFYQSESVSCSFRPVFRYALCQISLRVAPHDSVCSPLGTATTSAVRQNRSRAGILSVSMKL